VYYLTIALVVKQKPNQAIADSCGQEESVAYKRICFAINVPVFLLYAMDFALIDRTYLVSVFRMRQPLAQRAPQLRSCGTFLFSSFSIFALGSAKMENRHDTVPSKLDRKSGRIVVRS
jgi:hypothetical protein